jgi:uncharacterized membrane protein (GlpM family)
MEEMALRILIGGMVVSAFALLGDLFKPKRFAGLFAAAPSVALATLGLTVASEGKSYAAAEAHAMVAGAIAFFIYASSASWLLIRHRMPVLRTTAISTVAWLAVALGLWFLWLK